MYKRKAFTLIELLVVISIIALLISILMPALNVARQQATGTVCQGNQKTLALAWTMYADDNDGRLVGNSVDNKKSDGSPGPQWVQPPQYEDGKWLYPGDEDETNDEYRFNGIRAGDLWKYYESLEVLHCPADDRWSKNDSPRDAYRSYGMPYSMGYGNSYATSPRSWITYRAYLKNSDIKYPSRKYIFVEEDHLAMFGYNNGGWHLPIDYNGYNVPGPGGWDPATFGFYDPVGIWHNKKSTFAFADGHVEMHRWEDERTQELVEMYDSKDMTGVIYHKSANNKDVKWLLDGFIDKNRLF